VSFLAISIEQLLRETVKTYLSPKRKSDKVKTYLSPKRISDKKSKGTPIRVKTFLTTNSKRAHIVDKSRTAEFNNFVSFIMYYYVTINIEVA